MGERFGPVIHFTVSAGGRQSDFVGEPRVDGGEDERGEHGGSDQAADDDSGERALDFRAGGGGDGHRQEAETGDERGHEDRSQADHRGLAGGGVRLDSFLPQVLDGADPNKNR